MSWQPVDSSAATAVRYNPQRQWLDVEYTSGGRYRYFSVPPEVHQELLAADSIGTYLNQSIKPCYACSKLPSARN
jgi:hypothetical protein